MAPAEQSMQFRSTVIGFMPVASFYTLAASPLRILLSGANRWEAGQVWAQVWTGRFPRWPCGTAGCLPAVVSAAPGQAYRLRISRPGMVNRGQDSAAGRTEP